MRWVNREGGYYYVNPDAVWGVRTKASVFRCCTWGSTVESWVCKVNAMPKAVSFDERDDALKYAETVCALKGE